MKTISAGERGNSTVELALVFLPLFMMLLMILDLGRGLWMFHTLNTAVKRGTRTASVHGSRCAEASAQCQMSVGTLMQAIETAGVGMDPSQLTFVLTSGSDSRTCQPASSCHGIDTAWPPKATSGIGTLLKIRGTYTFSPLLSVLWPGGGGPVTLAAESSEMVQF